MDRATARALLGVDPEAGGDAVDRAFRREAARHHPDRGGDPQRFGQLVEARAVLRHARPAGSVRFVRSQPFPQRAVQDVRRKVEQVLRRSPPRVQ